MSNVMIFDHPLIQHKIGIIRDENTTHKLFRELVSELQCWWHMKWRAISDDGSGDQHSICKTTVRRPADDKISIVPILRAGLGMVDGMLNLLPNAKVGHIGLYGITRHCNRSVLLQNAGRDQHQPVIVLWSDVGYRRSGNAAINILKEKRS
jgi:uracil phosphoribosyltransferase